jgi:hypothetical protein
MKLKAVFAGLAVVALTSQTFAQRIDHPFIKCNEYENLAQKIMTYRANGADQKKMIRAMELTGEDPQFGIQANMGLKMIEKAFAVNVPQNADNRTKAKIVANFTQQQKQFCDDILDGKIN